MNYRRDRKYKGRVCPVGQYCCDIHPTGTEDIQEEN
jgi:hypothetical protein